MDSALASKLEPALVDALGRVETLLQELLQLGHFSLEYEVRHQQPVEGEPEQAEIVIDLSGDDSGLLLEGHAALLDAFDHVVRKAARLDEHLAGRISFDCEEWRAVHIRELQLTAQLAADRVVASGDSYELSPMDSRDRRVVHLALKDRLDVRTESRGFGTARKVVILPAPPSQPAGPLRR